MEQRQELRKAGLKITLPRLKILEILEGAANRHPSAEDIYSGYEFVETVSQESGLPLEFITVSQELLPKIDMKRFSCAVLPIARQLVPPWLKVSEFRN